MEATRRHDRLQKILYVVMALLGSYILYQGAGLLLESQTAQRALEAGTVQRALEDAAARTWTSGYTAVVEEKDRRSGIAAWMRPAAPVFSYLAEQGTAELEETAESAKAAEAAKTAETAETEEAAKIAETAGTEEAAKTAEPEKTAETAGSAGSAESEKEKSGNGKRAEEALSRAVSPSPVLLEQLSDFSYFLNQYFTVDGGTSADETLLNAEELFAEDLRLSKDPSVPQILIYHTHSQEAFADSRTGAVEDTIVGMGEVLAEHLRDKGYQVIHDTGVYDLVDGVLDRSAAYDYARSAVEQILKQHPTIEVLIDLHRDGVEGKKFVTEIDGKPCSMIMFFNGLSQDSRKQPLSWLDNPYRKQNLAFSLQLEQKAREQYPGYTRNIYLKAERFNLHLRPRALLVEAGTQMNTVEEERNAMKPLAELISQVLSGT